MAHIVKLVAGVEDELPAGAAGGQQGGGGGGKQAAAAAKSWKEQLELNYASAGSGVRALHSERAIRNLKMMAVLCSCVQHKIKLWRPPPLSRILLRIATRRRRRDRL